MAVEVFGFTQASIYGWLNVFIIVGAIAVLYLIIKSAMDR